MSAAVDSGNEVIISWLGHSCFQIKWGQVTIITDPAPPETGYQIPKQEADIVTISHDHWDHNYRSLVTGQPQVYDQVGSYSQQGIKITGLASWHDPKRVRGENLIFRFDAPKMSLAHLGDLGEKPTNEVMEQLSDLDVLMVPVGGNFTMDAEAAYQLCCELRPKAIIPMHYKTKHLSFALDPAEKFLLKFPRVQKLPRFDVRYVADSEPAVIVLDYPLTSKREEG